EDAAAGLRRDRCWCQGGAAGAGGCDRRAAGDQAGQERRRSGAVDGLDSEISSLVHDLRACMAKAKNIIWIMCDQLRHDYLGCTGHPTLKTPNIDAMAGRGVRFTNAYVQSPICGRSRMSFYTGRYMRSHGSHWNGW